MNDPHDLPLGACSWAFVWRNEIEETLTLLRRLGYQTIDVLTVPPHPWPSTMDAAERSRVRASAARCGMRIESLNVPSTDVNLCSVNPDMRAYTIAELTNVLQLAADLGVAYVTCVPGRRLNFNAPGPERVAEWLDRGLEDLVRGAERIGVEILLELHPMSCLPTTEQMVSHLDRLPLPHLGLALDVTNAAFVGEDPVEAIRSAARWIRQVHLSDAKAGTWAHDVIGTGDVDFDSIAGALRSIGFGGTSIVEIVCDDAELGYATSRARLEARGWA